MTRQQEVTIMRKIWVLCLVLAMCCVGIAAAEGGLSAEVSGNTIQGRLADGSYILSIPVSEEEAGEWTADDMSQDDSVVKLNYARLENGVFEARYDPSGDGKVTVCIRHMSGPACDQAYTFDLLVKDGKIQEVTGGSGNASPDAEKLAEEFAGEWLEAETQFTQMTIAAGEEGSLNAEVVSPMTHGAYLFRMTLHYDCELDAFVYNDGAVYDLPITDSDEYVLGDPVGENLSGRLLLMADEQGRTVLNWYSELRPEEPDIVFVRTAD